MSGRQRIIWLASFPKSGNTWTRTFLGNYFAGKDDALDINSLRRFTTTDVRQDFFDRAAGQPFKAQTFDEWLLLRPKALRLIAEGKPGHHFVKTHSQVRRVGHIDLIPPELTAAAIYIIRNPFDVALSYSRHLGLSLEDTVTKMRDPKAFNSTPTLIFDVTGSWDQHATSWIDAPGLPCHVMRYEDMLTSPEKAFRGLFGFLNMRIDDGQLRRALRRSSFKEMQRQERDAGFIERPAEMAQFFVSGTSGGWRTDMPPHLVAQLREAFLPALERWYPEILTEAEAVAAKA